MPRSKRKTLRKPASPRKRDRPAGPVRGDNQPGQNAPAAAERRVLALRLKQSGATVRDIAAQLHVSKSQVARDIDESLAELAALERHEAKAYRELQLSRLDAFLMVLERRTSLGDPEAVRAALAIMARQDKLCGVDAIPGLDTADFLKTRAAYLAEREKLRDLDPILADLWALRDSVLKSAQTTPVGADGKVPPALLAVLGELATALERVARIEAHQRAAVTFAHLDALLDAAVATLEKYLPRERVREAVTELVRLGRDQFGLGPAPPRSLVAPAEASAT